MFRVALVKRETFQRTRKSTKGEVWLAMRRCDANSCRTVADVRQTSAGENTTTLTRESHLTCTSGTLPWEDSVHTTTDYTPRGSARSHEGETERRERDCALDSRGEQEPATSGRRVYYGTSTHQLRFGVHCFIDGFTDTSRWSTRSWETAPESRMFAKVDGQAGRPSELADRFGYHVHVVTVASNLGQR